MCKFDGFNSSTGEFSSLLKSVELIFICDLMIWCLEFNALFQLNQPRILMAMARDGLLPSFFSDINVHTRVPIKSTIVTGFFIGVLSFFMDVSQLAGMVS